MSQTPSLSTLLGNTGLSTEAAAAMELTVDTLGPAIMAGLGEVRLDDIASSEVILVTQLIDDSGSIQSVPGNPEAVRVGHNSVLEALQGSKQIGDVLISCRYLNDNPPTSQGVLYPYRPLSGAIKLDASNYDPVGGTPLYDQLAVMLTGVGLKMAEFEMGGVAARSISVVVTDGHDEHSYSQSPQSVRGLVEAMLASEQSIIAGVGIDDGGRTDFRAIFGELGIPDRWILTPGNSPSEIRKAFQVISQSAVRASQSAGSFSQTALGGFGTP